MSPICPRNGASEHLFFQINKVKILCDTHTQTHNNVGNVVKKGEKKTSNSILPRTTSPCDIFIDKCATQSRSILSSSGGNMVLVILGGMGVRVMIDYS